MTPQQLTRIQRIQLHWAALILGAFWAGLLIDWAVNG